MKGYNAGTVAESGEVTRLLHEVRDGRQEAIGRLMELLYAELRRMAKGRMHAEKAGHTLSATALVHEAYLRLASGADLAFEDRNHFLAVAAQAMRRVLVDHARARQTARRGGKEVVVCLDEAVIAAPVSDDQMLALDVALQQLASFNPRQCSVVELKYFAGLTEDQIAGVLGVARRTVCRDWQVARAWLHSAVASGSPS